MEIDGRSAASKRKTVTGSSEPCDSEVEGVEKYSVSPKLTATLPEGLTDKAAPLTLTSTSSPVPEGAEDQGKPPWWGAVAGFIGGGIAGATGLMVTRRPGIKTMEGSEDKSRDTGFLTEVEPGEGLPPLWEEGEGEPSNPFQAKIDIYNPGINEMEHWKMKADYNIEIYAGRQKEDLEWLAEYAKTMGEPSIDLHRWEDRGEVASLDDVIFDVGYCQSEMACIQLEKRLIDHRLSDIKKYGASGSYSLFAGPPHERFIMIHNRRIPEYWTSELTRKDLRDYLDRKKHHKKYCSDEIFEEVYTDAIKNSDVILKAEDDLRELGADMTKYKRSLPDH